MKHSMAKLIAIILITISLLFCVSCTVKSKSIYEENGISYYIGSNYCSVYDISNKAGKNVVIPAQVNGHTVNVLDDRKALFEKMRGALINPIRRRTSVKWIDITDQCLIAGDSALARKTMLNDNMFRYYAVDGKVQCKELPYAMDANTDVNLELWKYDPKLLSKGEMVDVLSLAMSFDDEEDERIQEAVEDLLQQLWED